MAVVAKFRCGEVKRVAWANDQGVSAEEVKLTAVYSDDPDHPNHQWSKFTPSGDIEMQITNPDAFGYFEPGAEYTVTLRKARTAAGFDAEATVMERAWADVDAGRTQELTMRSVGKEQGDR